MTVNRNLDRLIEILCEERGEAPPAVSGEEKPRLFRALSNVRPPLPVTEEFLRLQDEYLSAAVRDKGIVDVATLRFEDGIALWQGDITRLNADAIVNAANSALLGCFYPLHGCIDNAIHSAAGVQVRLECNRIMRGGEEPAGSVKVTGGYNLPCRYIFHTVGPVVYGKVTARNEADLRGCYVSCLEEAERRGLYSLAFCCISTGEFRYPREEACRVAVAAVREKLAENKSGLKVVFDVFTDEDRRAYEKELRRQP